MFESNLAADIEKTNLRMVCGSDRSLAPIARFARRWRVLPLPIGASGLRQPVHADDLAQAIVATIDCPATFGKTYALGGGERLPFGEMLWRLRGTLPGFVLPLPLPAFALRFAAGVAGRSFAQVGGGALARLREPLIADHSEAVRDFGYSPRAFIAADVPGPAASGAD